MTTGNLSNKAGVSFTYGDTLHKHAVTALSNGSSFSYDANGNMTTRSVGGQTFNLSYDAENRMTGVTGAATANFVYDDTGARVIATEGVTTTIYVGSYFEWRGTITDTVKFYYVGTVRVAMRKGDGEPLFLLGDHLGSTNRLVHADGTPVTPGGMRLYKAWGEARYEPDGELATEYRFTGQPERQSIGLYFYGARWYDPSIMRFVSPDTVVPGDQGIYSPLTVDYHETQFLEQLNEENRTSYRSSLTNPPPVPTNVQSFDRYSYVSNNPLKYVDPSGHCFGYAGGLDTAVCTAFAAAGPPGWIVDGLIIIGGLIIFGGAAIAAADVYSEHGANFAQGDGGARSSAEHLAMLLGVDAVAGFGGHPGMPDPDRRDANTNAKGLRNSLRSIQQNMKSGETIQEYLSRQGWSSKQIDQYVSQLRNYYENVLPFEEGYGVNPNLIDELYDVIETIGAL